MTITIDAPKSGLAGFAHIWEYELVYSHACGFPSSLSKCYCKVRDARDSNPHTLTRFAPISYYYYCYYCFCWHYWSSKIVTTLTWKRVKQNIIIIITLWGLAFRNRRRPQLLFIYPCACWKRLGNNAITRHSDQHQSRAAWAPSGPHAAHGPAQSRGRR